MAEEEPARAAPLCPHRPKLAAELVCALRQQAAVSLSDVMLRRPWQTQGPCLPKQCKRGANALSVRERCWLVDDDPLLALAAVREEVDRLRGAAAG